MRTYFIPFLMAAASLLVACSSPVVGYRTFEADPAAAATAARETAAKFQAALEALRKERTDPQAVTERFRRERRLSGDLAQAQALLEKLESIPNYDAGLFHRIGRCFFNTDRYWEARVAFTRVVQEAEDETLREAAHFDLILVLSRMRRFDDLIEEADRYLAKYEQYNP